MSTVYAQQGDEKLIKESFEYYKAAILNDQGLAALNYIDSQTVRYYGNILDLVRNADSAQVANLSIFDKFMVFVIRHRASRMEILMLDGKGLLVYAIQNGMVGKNSVANNTIGSVVIAGSSAKGQLLSRGRKVPVEFVFHKESGTWKIDLTSIFEISGAALQKMADDSGQSANDYLFSMIEMSAGSKPGPQIWRPVQ